MRNMGRLFGTDGIRGVVGDELNNALARLVGRALVSVLASPVFGFSPDMLAVPRTKNRKTDLYDAICEDREHFGAFLSLLETLREDLHWLFVLQRRFYCGRNLRFVHLV